MFRYIKKIQIKRNIFKILFLIFAMLVTSGNESFSDEKRTPIIVNGDKVEFFSAGKQVIAEGDVVVEYEDAKLTCDKITVYNETKQGIAEGNVVLIYPKIDEEGKEVITVIKGKKATYNFETKEGKLIDSEVESIPFYGRSKQADKVSDEELKIKKGYITTCNLDRPHYRLRAKRVFIYPGDKIVARNLIFMAGECPVFYIPKYVQRIDDKRPRVTVVPGRSKAWGNYLLTAWRYYLIEGQEGRLHLDYREKKDFAWGFTHKYKLLGDGLLKTYYMHERNIQADHIWKEKEEPTIERERFKIQWYHKKEIDERTTALLEYHKFHDQDFLKDYFLRENEKASTPATYFLLTYGIPIGTLSFHMEKRINRFYSTVERLPEIKLDTAEQQVFKTPLYFSNLTSFSYLRKKDADIAQPTSQAKRFDAFNKLSLPKKIAFINIDPYVGGRHTYYTRDTLNNPDHIRGIFYSGIDMSTKFFRIFNVEGDFLGVQINKLRHVVTPTVEYSYIHEPTASNLLDFDSIDSISQEHQMTFSLENKLQTKRNKSSCDLLRFIVSAPYQLRQGSTHSSFSSITSDLEFTPTDRLRFEMDTSYDTTTKYFTSVNTDFSISGEDGKWSFGLGRRWQRKGTRQLETQARYRVNPKWEFSVYERFYPTFDRLKEQEYVIKRDLHCWELTISYNVTRGKGEEIWLALRLKAFPEMGFEFNKGYHGPKVGSQSGRSY